MTQTKCLTINEITSLAQAAEGEAGSAAEELQVFSDDGAFLGTAPRLLCHRLGLIHKVVFCFITDDHDRLLLQSRGSGRLDVAVGGHLSKNDESPEIAVAREMVEEIGLMPERSRLLTIANYLRVSGGRTAKPRDFNRELRQLFVYRLAEAECRQLESAFQERQDKSEVRSISWFDVDKVIEACDRGEAADGLAASVVHYLLWLGKGRQV